MAIENYDVDDTAPCGECEVQTDVLVPNCINCGAVNVHLTLGEFIQRFSRKQFLDARLGGYIIGRDGPEDDIPMFQISAGNLITLIGMMQGGEYVVSTNAAQRNRDEIIQINSQTGRACDLEVELPFPNCNVLNVNQCQPLDGLSPSGALLVDSGQFVVNRFATKENFARLEEINSLVPD